VARWWTPDEFEAIRRAGEALGFSHIQSSPLTRSSYHARQAAEASSPADLSGVRIGPSPAVPLATR
jgi:lipoic acid synthetase